MPKTAFLETRVRTFTTIAVLGALVCSTGGCQEKAPPADAKRPQLRDIGKVVVNGMELRKAPLPTRRQGRVDVDKTLARVKAAGADAFVYHIGNGENDWDDFKLLAAGADKQGVKLWGAFRLVSHRANSLPFMGDFEKWCSSIAEVAKKHPSIVAILLPQLEQGRNSKFLHGRRVATMRRLANAGGLSLIGSVFDPEPEWVELYKDSLDGIMLRWTKFNNMLNLPGMLSGVAAMCPKSWKRLVCYEARAYFGAKKPIDADSLAAMLAVGMRRSDGVAVHLLDLANPATVDRVVGGDSAQWKAVRAFAARWRASEAKRKR